MPLKKVIMHTGKSGITSERNWVYVRRVGRRRFQVFSFARDAENATVKRVLGTIRSNASGTRMRAGVRSVQTSGTTPIRKPV
jgi:hypothetical protein